MSIFLKVLQGPYAYLLIFQILVVCVLSVTFLILLVKRMKDQAALLATPDGAGVETSTEMQAKFTEMEVDNKRLKEFEAKWLPHAALDIEKLKQDSERLKTIDQDIGGYKQKIDFLEKKLLEYQILQEEIGNLSTIKAENAKLKAQLGLPVDTPPAPAPVQATPPTPQASSVEPSPAAPAPQNVVSMEVPPTAQPPKTEPAGMEAASPLAKETAAEMGGEMGALMKQIEDIASGK